MHYIPSSTIQYDVPLLLNIRKKLIILSYLENSTQQEAFTKVNNLFTMIGEERIISQMGTDGLASSLTDQIATTYATNPTLPDLYAAFE